MIILIGRREPEGKASIYLEAFSGEAATRWGRRASTWMGRLRRQLNLKLTSTTLRFGGVLPSVVSLVVNDIIMRPVAISDGLLRGNRESSESKFAPAECI